MVTRVTSDGALGADLAAQLFARPDVLRSAGALLLVLSFVPALPRPVFLLLGITSFVLAHFAVRRKRQHDAKMQAERERAKRHAMRRPELALGLVGVDAISIDVGAGIAQLLAPPLADALLDRIGEVRRALASEIGIVLPGVRLRDDLARDPQSYAIRVRDRVVGEGRLELARCLAVGEDEVLRRLQLTPEPEPVYGLPGAWIDAADRERVAGAGALVFDPVSVIGSHVAETARRHAAELVGRQELQTLFEHLRAGAPALMRDVGSDALPLGVVHKAFGHLLRERAWPRDPLQVLQAMLEAPSRDPRDLAEAARRTIVPEALRRRGIEALRPLLLDPECERDLAQRWAGSVPDPALALELCERVAAYAADTAREEAALVCTTALRPVVSEVLRRSGVPVDVFSYAELPPELQLLPAGMVNLGFRAQAV